MARVGGKRAKSTLKYPEAYYVPGTSTFKKLTEREVRAEYARLQSIARKRIERFEKSPMAYVYEDYIKRNKGRFPTLGSISTKAQLAQKFADVASFIQSPLSSLSSANAYYAKLAKTVSKHLDLSTIVGKELTQADLRIFGQFMEYNRAQKKAKVYDSNQVAQVAMEAERLGINADEIKKDFKYFYNHLEQLKQLDKVEASKRTKTITSYKLKEAIREIKRR